jgi:hypothetical protein
MCRSDTKRTFFLQDLSMLLFVDFFGLSGGVISLADGTSLSLISVDIFPRNFVRTISAFITFHSLSFYLRFISNFPTYIGFVSLGAGWVIRSE